jgi:hypothetical protein
MILADILTEEMKNTVHFVELQDLMMSSFHYIDLPTRLFSSLRGVLVKFQILSHSFFS